MFAVVVFLPLEAEYSVLLFPMHANLQVLDGKSQMGSGFSRKVCTRAHIGGQLLTSEGQTCSLGMAFTK
jgi:hypothetical protein